VENDITLTQFQIFTIYDVQNIIEPPLYSVIDIDLPTYDEILKNNQTVEFDRALV
jgi:hypothetical protein